MNIQKQPWFINQLHQLWTRNSGSRLAIYLQFR